MGYILAVDDDKRIRMVVKKYFTTLGYIVDEAENGLIAVDLVKKAPQKYLVVIMDMMMPEMNGLEAFDEIRNSGIEVPVIMATAYGNLTLGVEFMKRGGADFIEKPLSLEVLALKVNQVVERKKLREAIMAEKVVRHALVEVSKQKRDFLNKITHEFRTPIHAILNLSKFGLNNESQEKNQNYFQNINDSGKKLLELIDGLLAYNKMETDVSQFEIARHDIINSYLQALKGFKEIQTNDETEFIFSNMPEGLFLHFDSKRLKQTLFRVFDNLSKLPSANKKAFVLLKSSNIQLVDENSAPVMLPAYRFYFAKFTETIAAENIEHEIELFIARYKALSESMTGDFDLMLYENIIKAHRGEFKRIYMPGRGIIFELALPISN